MIIGLTGTYCSGKDTVADYLVARKGFAHFSLSDELRKEMRRRGLELTRENLIDTGTELRQQYGNGVLAEMVLRECPPANSCVITSIRHPAEVAVLSARKDFTLVTLDAPAELRFARMRRRARPGDPETFDKFKELERRESQVSGPGQQVTACCRMAAVTLLNDGEKLSCLYHKVDDLLKRLEGVRPE